MSSKHRQAFSSAPEEMLVLSSQSTVLRHEIHVFHGQEGDEVGDPHRRESDKCM